ncbi:MAG: hypothetical protein AAF488_17190, partial [Planctomycetota bacterium]
RKGQRTRLRIRASIGLAGCVFVESSDAGADTSPASGYVALLAGGIAATEVLGEAVTSPESGVAASAGMSPSTGC